MNLVGVDDGDFPRMNVNGFIAAQNGCVAIGEIQELHVFVPVCDSDGAARRQFGPMQEKRKQRIFVIIGFVSHGSFQGKTDEKGNSDGRISTVSVYYTTVSFGLQALFRKYWILSFGIAKSYKKIANIFD